MGRIKLNLVSGAVVEKPLVNAFKVNENSYVVLDNEMNGSMGLPIILVSKLQNNMLSKIADANEWQSVKDYLKNIISGNTMEYIKLSNELAAEDIYYTQLTLPVSSFDALKNAYVEPAEASNATVAPTSEIASPIASDPINNIQMPSVDPVVNVAPVNNVQDNFAPQMPTSPMPNPTVEVNNVVNPFNIPPVIEQPTPMPTPAPEVETTPAPIHHEVTPSVDNTVPVMDINIPTIETPVVPAVNNFDVTTPITPVVQIEEPTMPVAPSPIAPTVSKEDMFKEQKEAFMQACENMFDALVQKFEKELDNKNN